MFLEEYSLDTADVLWPHAPSSAAPDISGLPAPGTLLGCGSGLFWGSSLFAASSLRRKTWQEKTPVRMFGTCTAALYSGERLDQGDLDVFLDCLLDARPRRGLTGTLGELSRRLGRKHGKTRAEGLKSSLLRLARGRIELSDARFSVSARLLDSVLLDHEGQSFRAFVSQEARAALGNLPELAVLHRLRLALRAKPLAKWLAGFILAGADSGMETDQEAIQALCGREHTEPGLFAAQLRTALGSLREKGFIRLAPEQEHPRRVTLQPTGRAYPSWIRLHLTR